MPVGRKWETLEIMDLLQKEPSHEEVEGEITMAVTTSPKPPPKAPTTFAREPIGSNQSLLGGKD